MRYRTGIDAFPSQSPRSVFWRWIGYWSLPTDGMFFSKLPSATSISFLTRNHSMERPCTSFLSVYVYTFMHMTAVMRQSYSDYDDKDRTIWDSDFFLVQRKKCFFQPNPPDRTLGTKNLISKGYWGLFFSEKGWACSEVMHFSLMPRSIMHVDLPTGPHTPSRRRDYLCTKQFYLLYMPRYVCLCILYIFNYYSSFTLKICVSFSESMNKNT